MLTHPAARDVPARPAPCRRVAVPATELTLYLLHEAAIQVHGGLQWLACTAGPLRLLASRYAVSEGFAPPLGGGGKGRRLA